MERWKTRFFTIWTGQSLSLVGSAAAQFALVWWVAQKTGSATILATATLVALIPGVILSPFAGVIVDRVSRKWVILLSDGFIALVSLWLAYLFWTGNIQIGHVYVVMFLRSLGGAFHQPAMGAATTLMVPKEQFARVDGLNQAMGGALNVISPPLGAFLIAILSISSIMLIDVATAAFAILGILPFPVPNPERAERRNSVMREFAADFREGFHFIIGWRDLAIFVGMLVGMNFLFGPTATLLPLLVTEHFGGNQFLLGWFQSGSGFGLIIGGLVLSLWGIRRNRMVLAALGFVGQGLAVLLLGSAPAHMGWIGIVALWLSGITLSIAVGCMRATYRTAVPPKLQGRVFSLTSSLCVAANPLAVAIAGPLSDACGIRFWYLLAGGGLVLGGIVGLIAPTLRRFEAEANRRSQELNAAES
jgi:DHA3 family macrolide efflux protein-like MFS transporter